MVEEADEMFEDALAILFPDEGLSTRRAGR
jgi:hypothetical protein